MSAARQRTQSIIGNGNSSPTNDSRPAPSAANQNDHTTRKMTRLERGVRLRDFAVAIVRARGTWGPFGSSRALGFEREGLSITYVRHSSNCRRLRNTTSTSLRFMDRQTICRMALMCGGTTRRS
jgi:hypothetical protein